MELSILVWIQNHLVFEQLNGFFIFITNFWGNGIWGLLLATFLILKKETRLTGLALLVSLTLCGLFVKSDTQTPYSTPTTLYGLRIPSPDSQAPGPFLSIWT